MFEYYLKEWVDSTTFGFYLFAIVEFDLSFIDYYILIILD